MHSSFFRCWLCFNLWKNIGNSTEIVSKTTKTSNVSTISGSIWSISFRNWTYLLTKAHKNNNLLNVQGFFHSSLRSLSIVWQKLNKSGENRKIYELLFFSMSIPDKFYLQNCIYLSTKHTGYPIHSLWTRSHIPISGVCRKFGKNCIEFLKIGYFWGCLSISVSNSDSFEIKNFFISPLKVTGQRVAVWWTFSTFQFSKCVKIVTEIA